ncbi:uncharacterized protein [Diadema setosum]|uniref:uncharacterized protein n=1 Tax=Diadema setosum TaxID=31175 RepID=UPI003B3BD8DF
MEALIILFMILGHAQKVSIQSNTTKNRPPKGGYEIFCTEKERKKKVSPASSTSSSLPVADTNIARRDRDSSCEWAKISPAPQPDSDGSTVFEPHGLLSPAQTKTKYPWKSKPPKGGYEIFCVQKDYVTDEEDECETKPNLKIVEYALVCPVSVDTSATPRYWTNTCLDYSIFCVEKKKISTGQTNWQSFHCEGKISGEITNAWNPGEEHTASMVSNKPETPGTDVPQFCLHPAKQNGDAQKKTRREPSCGRRFPAAPGKPVDPEPNYDTDQMKSSDVLKDEKSRRGKVRLFRFLKLAKGVPKLARM